MYFLTLGESVKQIVVGISEFKSKFKKSKLLAYVPRTQLPIYRLWGKDLFRLVNLNFLLTIYVILFKFCGRKYLSFVLLLLILHLGKYKIKVRTPFWFTGRNPVES